MNIKNFLNTAWSDTRSANRENWAKTNFKRVLGIWFCVYLIQFAYFAYAAILSPEDAINIIQTNDSVTIISLIAVTLLFLTIGLYVGDKAYDRYVGPYYRHRNWNEFSFIKNLLTIPVWMILFMAPILLLLFARSVFLI